MYYTDLKDKRFATALLCNVIFIAIANLEVVAVYTVGC